MQRWIDYIPRNPLGLLVLNWPACHQTPVEVEPHGWQPGVACRHRQRLLADRGCCAVLLRRVLLAALFMRGSLRPCLDQGRRHAPSLHAVQGTRACFPAPCLLLFTYLDLFVLVLCVVVSAAVLGALCAALRLALVRSSSSS